MLVDELHSHDHTITLLLQSGRELIHETHYASAEIQAGIDKLNNSWKALTQQAHDRSHKLNESLRLQQVCMYVCNYNVCSINYNYYKYYKFYYYYTAYL